MSSRVLVIASALLQITLPLYAGLQPSGYYALSGKAIGEAPSIELFLFNDSRSARLNGIVSRDIALSGGGIHLAQFGHGFDYSWQMGRHTYGFHFAFV